MANFGGYLERRLFVSLPPTEYKKLKGLSFNLVRTDLLLKVGGLCGCHEAVSGHSQKKAKAEMYIVSYSIYATL